MFNGTSRITVGLCCAAIFLIGFSSLAWSAQSDYDGAYAGTYTGDDNGYWVAVVDSTGTSGFVSWSSVNDMGRRVFGLGWGGTWHW